MRLLKRIEKYEKDTARVSLIPMNRVRADQLE